VIKWTIFQLHWLLGITVGVVLSVMGVTGAIMSFEDQIMAAASHGIVDVPVRTGPALLPDALLERFEAQMPGAEAVKLTLFPRPGASPRIIYRPPNQNPGADDEDTDSVYLDPYTGRWLGKAHGEVFFDNVRLLHRFLLLPHHGSGPGRPITLVAALCLIFFALSGLYMRWPRRALDWRAWLKPDLDRRGRNLYWSLHSVAGTWLFLVYLVIAISGPSFGYHWYRDGLFGILTGTAVSASKGLTVRQAPTAPQTETSPGGPRPASLDAAWRGFQSVAPNTVATVVFPVSRQPSHTLIVRYLNTSSPHYRAYNEMTIDPSTGAVRKHTLYARQPLGKQLSVGLLAVHRGTWFGLPGAIIFMLAAASVPLFCITGYLLYLDRRRKKSAARLAREGLMNIQATLTDTQGEVLIAYASQSGTAEQIAWRSANELIHGGRAARVAALGALDIPQMRQAKTLLVIASTFGAGEPPDSARVFARNVLRVPADLTGLRCGVLALGHSDYPDFCGFGRSVNEWLHSSGVDPLFPLIELDAGDSDALDSWRQQLHSLGGAAQADAGWQPVATRPWRLAQRTLLNPGSAGAEAYHLVLEAPEPTDLNWTAGDIAVIVPRRKRLESNAVEQVESGLTREYSISSLAASGRLELLVRKTVLADGQLGLGSGWLTQHAALGEPLHLRIRSNPNFHPPRTSGPMILIGAGTGLAGLRAHLLHRQHNGVRGAWLLFGERSSRTDRFHGEQIEAWMRDGTLARCDLVFSRDSAQRLYVQHRIEEAADPVRKWVKDDGAAIFVCGGLKMGAAVHAALQEILGAGRLDEMAATGSYRRDVY
jgi:sulfite reductase (NADPH) flavoprotein alpha-component